MGTYSPRYKLVDLPPHLKRIREVLLKPGTLKEMYPHLTQGTVREYAHQLYVALGISGRVELLLGRIKELEDQITETGRTPGP